MKNTDTCTVCGQRMALGFLAHRAVCSGAMRSDAEERFARRVKGAAYRRLKGEMANGDPLRLPTTKEQMDELERSRMEYLRDCPTKAGEP